ncbi:MAG: hypothetical protein CL912_32045 [Deltaproteobacteria bacterium]|nr:hypothetical protein [Deltaproteobacteria bacterium]
MSKMTSNMSSEDNDFWPNGPRWTRKEHSSMLSLLYSNHLPRNPPSNTTGLPYSSKANSDEAAMYPEACPAMESLPCPDTSPL